MNEQNRTSDQFHAARLKIGGLRGVLRALNDAPENEHKWTNLPKCPFCGSKDSSGVWEKEGREFFKCHNSGCSTDGKVMTEVSYIAARLELSKSRSASGMVSPAYQKFLELTGCWKESSGQRGVVGPANDTTQKKTLKDYKVLPQNTVSTPGAGDTNPLPPVTKFTPHDPEEVPYQIPTAGIPSISSSNLKPEILPQGMRALREFFHRLTPTDCEITARLPDGETLDGLTAAVLKRLQFAPVPMFLKRGLNAVTCQALAFRANPRIGNEAILRDLREEFDWEELVASGLWLEADRKMGKDRRPNTQFCGKGQIGRKPEKERRNPDDKWVWGWSEPTLIPYFDMNGQIIKLRPHKGGAPAGTIAGSEHIYIPRATPKAAVVEKFNEVTICESEYKAAAIWQTIGAGAKELDGEQPMGVCSIPGISFAKNVQTREELAEWLTEVGCKKVYVAFDDEDKSHKPLRQRCDAQIYARYLAIDLMRTLNLVALVCTLPREWRNEKGKADWDGALVKLYAAYEAEAKKGLL